MMVTDVGYLMYYVFLQMELFGLLVLLYHLTSYYPVRGGSSNGDTYCGLLCILAHNTVYNTYWGIGAAL